MELAEQKCTTYRAGSPPLTRKEVMELLVQVPGWLLDNGHLTRQFGPGNTSQCIEFFNAVMAIAVQEGQIPDVTLKEARYVTLSFYTYPAGGLTLNDFVMAAKINVLVSAR